MYVDFDLHVPVDQPQDWSLKRSTKEHKNVARAANIKYICSGFIQMCLWLMFERFVQLYTRECQTKY